MRAGRSPARPRQARPLASVPPPVNISSSGLLQVVERVWPGTRRAGWRQFPMAWVDEGFKRIRFSLGHALRNLGIEGRRGCIVEIYQRRHLASSCSIGAAYYRFVYAWLVHNTVVGSLVSFGVYVHYPYCIHRCPYCDFNVTAIKTPPHERYRAAVEAELSLRTEAIGSLPTAVSLYFGGGTPGIWPADHVAAIIQSVGRIVGLEPHAQVTIECNPGKTDETFFADLLEAGANRLSLGAQSFDDQL